MKRFFSSLTMLMLCFALLPAPFPVRAADTVVGNGAPASCTEAAFDAALAAANNGGGVITFNCGPGEVTINLTVVKLVNLGDVTIDGGGRVVLRAGPSDRHFFAGPVIFRLQNITLQQGDALVNGGAIEASGGQVFLENVRMLNNRSAVAGGAIYCYNGVLSIAHSQFEGNQAVSGGAIYNDGCEVDIVETTFYNNQTTGGGGRGGAVENAPLGKMTVRSSRFTGNSALDGGAIYVASGSTAVLDVVTLSANHGGYGGGLENSGALTMTNSLLTGNVVSGSGGGLWNLGGTALVQRTTFSGNTASEGGGVNTYGVSLVLQQVNISDNLASGTHGGGLYHGGGVAFVTNATLSGNRASSPAGSGGGIYQNSEDNLTLTNVTLVSNQAGLFGGGLYHYGRYAALINVTLGNNLAGTAGSAVYEDSPQTPANPGVVQIANSVLFGSANNCDGAFFQSLGHNLSQGNCASLTGAGDQENFPGSLLLGEMAFNGGVFPMRTMLPLAGSPLIDAGDAGLCPVEDQRSAGRLAACDIGAVEYGAAAHRKYLPLVVER